jgi:hypothetical protein
VSQSVHVRVCTVVGFIGTRPVDVSPRRLGVGFSQSGLMVGPANAKSNAIIFSPTDSTVAQYDMTAKSFNGITVHNTSGVSNLQGSQSEGVTTLSWTRGVNNGDANDAQISTTGGTWLVYAIGAANAFKEGDFPFMRAAFINLMTTVSYKYTAVLEPGLTLNWNVLGDVLQLQAVLNDTRWYVEVHSLRTGRSCSGSSCSCCMCVCVCVCACVRAFVRVCMRSIVGYSDFLPLVLPAVVVLLGGCAGPVFSGD